MILSAVQAETDRLRAQLRLLDVLAEKHAADPEILAEIAVDRAAAVKQLRALGCEP